VKSYSASTVFDYASAGDAEVVRNLINNRLRWEISGDKVELSDGYEWEVNPQKHEAGMRWFRMLQRIQDNGDIRAYPIRALDGGLEGILTGLKILKGADISRQKLVVRFN
jgi:hypothetical protein